MSIKIKDLVNKYGNQENIDENTRNRNERRREVSEDEAVTKAKEIKLCFLKSLAKRYQHYLPLDNDFL